MIQVSVPVNLSRYIHEQYNHNVSINTTEVLCNDEESVATCDFQFTGSLAKIALQLFVTDLTNSTEGINFNTYRL